MTHPLYDPDLIPPRIREALDDYGKHGLETGSCMRAVLEGKLFEAFAAADYATIAAMPSIVIYVTTRLPQGSWGSPAIVARWLADRLAERTARGSAR